MEEKDLRPSDNATLEQYGIHQDWINDWETELHKIEHPDKNQEKWSLSKRSYFLGYLNGVRKGN